MVFSPVCTRSTERVAVLKRSDVHQIYDTNTSGTPVTLRVRASDLLTLEYFAPYETVAFADFATCAIAKELLVTMNRQNSKSRANPGSERGADRLTL